MSVTIRQWPSVPTYHTVTLRDGSMGQMGCIDQHVPDGIYYFHAYLPYDRVSAHDRALVNAMVDAKVAELNTMHAITERLTR